MNSKLILGERILELEKKQAEAFSQMKIHSNNIYEGLKPVNLIKKTLESTLIISEVKENLIHALLGLVSGFVTKKLLVKNSESKIAKVLGTVIQFVVTALVAKNTDVIKKVSTDVVEYGLNLMTTQKKINDSETESV